MEAVKSRPDSVKTKYRVASQRLIEYFMRVFDDATTKQKKNVLDTLNTTKNGLNKRVKKMTIDEIMLYLGLMDSVAFIYICNTNGGYNINSLSQKIQHDIKNRERLGEKLGDRHIFVYSTAETLKYLAFSSNYQNSRFYLQNKNYTRLARERKERAALHESEESQTDAAIWLSVINTHPFVDRYLSTTYGLKPIASHILREIASVVDQSYGYKKLLVRCSSFMTEGAMKTALYFLSKNQFIYRFGENEEAEFQLAIKGWGAIKGALSYVNEKF